MEDAFVSWQISHDVIIANFPGYISTIIMPPGKAGGNQWTMTVSFHTDEQLINWQNSRELAGLVESSIPFLEKSNLNKLIEANHVEKIASPYVTEVLFTTIKSGMHEKYREWALRIQYAQAKFPGYLGSYLQPPSDSANQDRWMTLLRYDTAEHLQAWLDSSERQVLLYQASAFIENIELMQLATSYSGWVPIDPVSKKSNPNTKSALLVLLGLFPIIMLEQTYLKPPLNSIELNNALISFICTSLGVTLTSFVTMPTFIYCFSWWLFPSGSARIRTQVSGYLLISLILLIEIALFWNFPNASK
jgi:antibiotic biosynthesis monooxygenase (ABM) superfamily enzyme